MQVLPLAPSNKREKQIMQVATTASPPVLSILHRSEKHESSFVDFTGHLRWLVTAGHQPVLQQEYLERGTNVLKWKTVPFIHLKR